MGMLPVGAADESEMSQAEKTAAVNDMLNIIHGAIHQKESPSASEGRDLSITLYSKPTYIAGTPVRSVRKIDPAFIQHMNEAQLGEIVEAIKDDRLAVQSVARDPDYTMKNARVLLGAKNEENADIVKLYDAAKKEMHDYSVVHMDKEDKQKFVGIVNDYIAAKGAESKAKEEAKTEQQAESTVSEARVTSREKPTTETKQPATIVSKAKTSDEVQQAEIEEKALQEERDKKAAAAKKEALKEHEERQIESIEQRAEIRKKDV